MVWRERLALGGAIGGAALPVAASLAAVAAPGPHDGSRGWLLAGCWGAGALAIAAAAALARTLRELRGAEATLGEARAHQQTVVGELAHRNRNALLVVMAIVSQSAREAQSAEAAERTINSRLEALLRSQELVLDSSASAVGLGALLGRVLEPFDLARFAITDGPAVELEPELAMGLGLVFHELATNAVKHGALSAEGGRVLIEWTRDGQMAPLIWREVGGPPPRPAAKRGFGSRLLDVALTPQGGGAERLFEEAGLVCALRIPAPSDPRAARSPSPPGAEFAGEVLRP